MMYDQILTYNHAIISQNSNFFLLLVVQKILVNGPAIIFLPFKGRCYQKCVLFWQTNRYLNVAKLVIGCLAETTNRKSLKSKKKNPPKKVIF